MKFNLAFGIFAVVLAAALLLFGCLQPPTSEGVLVEPKNVVEKLAICLSSPLELRYSCNLDEDCICSGAGHFTGNKAYYDNCVDKSRIATDVCEGWGQPPVACVNNICTLGYPAANWTFENCSKLTSASTRAACKGRLVLTVDQLWESREEMKDKFVSVTGIAVPGPSISDIGICEGECCYMYTSPNQGMLLAGSDISLPLSIGSCKGQYCINSETSVCPNVSCTIACAPFDYARTYTVQGIVKGGRYSQEGLQGDYYLEVLNYSSASDYSNSVELTGALEVNFTVISKYYFYGAFEREFLFIQNQEAYTSLVSKLSERNPFDAPAINFSENDIVYAAMGTKPSGGYDIQIKNISEEDAHVKVVVVETSPSEGCTTTAAFTTPFQIVKTPKLTKPVVFVTEPNIRYCP